MKKVLQIASILAIIFLMFSCSPVNTIDGSTIGPSEGDENYYAGYVDPSTPGLKAIDLGLSVMWGDRNVGAAYPSDYGGLYVWADPSGKALHFYQEDLDMQEISGTVYDIAAMNLPEGWRLPTKEEVEELIGGCTAAKATDSGVDGYRLTSKDNGSSIFFPFAGYRYGDDTGFGEGNVGLYWTGTYDNPQQQFATYYYFGSPNDMPEYGNVNYGISVRPVFQGNGSAQGDGSSDDAEDNLPEGELFTEVVSSKINLHRGEVSKELQGTGTETDPFLISTAADLRKLADEVNDGNVFRGRYFRMTNDIAINRDVIDSEGNITPDISQYERWLPIGNYEKGYPFAGVFDGGGHTISGILIVNLYTDFCNSDLDDYQGLFGYASGIIKNIVLKDSYIYKGSIVGKFIANYEINGKDFTGDAIIESCVNYATVNGYYAGGICNEGAMKIDRCINYGTIFAETWGGGICAKSTRGVVSNCINKGSVYANDAGVGGISGLLNGAKVLNCINSGHIAGDVNDRVGGIISRTYTISDNYPSELTNCVNYGSAQSYEYMNGGITYDIGTGISKFNHCYFIYSFAEELYFDINIRDQDDYKFKIYNCSVMTSEEMKQQSFLDKLNDNAASLGEDYCRWISGPDGYPTLDLQN